MVITQKVIKIHISSIYESDAEFSSATVNLNKLFSKMNSLYFLPKNSFFNTFRANFFKKPPFNFTQIRFLLLQGMYSLKLKRSHRLRIVTKIEPPPARCVQLTQTVLENTKVEDLGDKSWKMTILNIRSLASFATTSCMI